MVACVRPPLGRAPVPPLGLPLQSTTSPLSFTTTTTAVFFLLEIYHVYVLCSLILRSPPPSTSYGKFLYLIPLAPLQCTARYGPPSVLGQQYENLAHVELTSKASQCHPQLVTVNRPLLKKKCVPGFHSAINVAAVQ